LPPNWFIGWSVPPPENLDRILAAPPRRVRVFSPADLHVTLAFLGPVGEPAAQRAFAVAERWAGPAIDARFGPVVPMGPPNRPSALAALVSDEEGALLETITALRSPICRAAGARRDKRPPRPHATVARPMRSASEEERAAAVAWGAGLELPTASFVLPSLALYTWNRDRRRQLFRVVERHMAPSRRLHRTPEAP
jgi:2'-5' RNA ligase